MAKSEAGDRVETACIEDQKSFLATDGSLSRFGLASAYGKVENGIKSTKGAAMLWTDMQPGVAIAAGQPLVPGCRGNTAEATERAIETSANGRRLCKVIFISDSSFATGSPAEEQSKKIFSFILLECFVHGLRSRHNEQFAKIPFPETTHENPIGDARRLIPHVKQSTEHSTHSPQRSAPRTTFALGGATAAAMAATDNRASK